MTQQVLLSIPTPEFENIIHTAVIKALQNNLPQPQTNSKEELLTRKTTAEYFGISLPTLNEWTKTGKVKGYRIGNRVRYKKDEVLQSLNAIGNFKGKGV